MNWKSLFGHIGKFRMAVYAAMALIGVVMALHLALVLEQKPDERPDRTIKASFSSPSGRRWFLLVDVYQQLFINLIDWNELIIGGVDEPGAKKTALKFNGRVYDIVWLDNQRARITIENTSVISHRLRDIDGVRLDVEFQPKNPARRREELVKRHTPREQWELYDLAPD